MATVRVPKGAPTTWAQHTPQINWGVSQASKLVFHATLGEQGESAAHDAVAALHQSAGLIHGGISAAGPARFRTDSTSNLSFGFFDRYKIGTGPFTCAVYGLLDTGSTLLNVISNNTAAGRASQWRIVTNYNGTAGSSGYLTFLTYGSSAISQVSVAAGIDPERPHWYFAVRNADGVLQLWRDSVLLTESSALTVRDVSGSVTDAISVGWATNNSTGRGISRASLWTRALRFADFEALTRAPSLLTQPRKIWVPVTVSAGGGGSHDATGAMSAQSATVSGSAAAVATYTSSGALTAQAATVAGTANHVTTHASSGVLEAQAATVAGSADHSAAGAFSATGALTAQAAVVAGSAAHLTLHTATGALASGSATAAGAAVHYTLHTAAGDLVADAASISGSALHEGDGAEVAKPFTGAGRPRRTRQRVVVEIDGEDFIAESVEEARALLDKAKDAAEEKASIAVKRATEAKKRPARKIVADARKSLALPTINAPGLEDYAGQIAQQIEDLYRSTIRTIEVESLLHNRDRAEEDDEDILLLIA